MTWMNEQDLEFTPVTSVRKAKSGKGWIVSGKDFDVFIWSSDKLLQQLLVALASWIDTGEGKQLEIKKETKEKRGFIVVPAMAGKKPVIARYRLLENGYEVLPEGELNESNPFL